MAEESSVSGQWGKHDAVDSKLLPMLVQLLYHSLVARFVLVSAAAAGRAHGASVVRKAGGQVPHTLRKNPRCMQRGLRALRQPQAWPLGCLLAGN